MLTITTTSSVRISNPEAAGRGLACVLCRRPNRHKFLGQYRNLELWGGRASLRPSVSNNLCISGQNRPALECRPLKETPHTQDCTLPPSGPTSQQLSCWLLSLLLQTLLLRGTRTGFSFPQHGCFPAGPTIASLTFHSLWPMYGRC